MNGKSKKNFAFYVKFIVFVIAMKNQSFSLAIEIDINQSSYFNFFSIFFSWKSEQHNKNLYPVYGLNDLKLIWKLKIFPIFEIKCKENICIVSCFSKQFFWWINIHYAWKKKKKCQSISISDVFILYSEIKW